MRIKTVTADTMTDALRLIRTQLGPEALILNTRKIKSKNGADTLEITAALNDDTPLPEPAAPPSRAVQIPPHANPLPNLTGSTLAAHGLAPSLIQTLETALPGLTAAGFTAAESVAMLLGKQLAFKPMAELLPMGAAHVFIGPHGAGKTTLVAKLALQAKQQGRQLGILSLDDQKIGGFEPLAIAAEIFGDAAHLITTRDDLQTAARTLGQRQALLLDTAGFNAFAPRALATLQQRLEGLGIPLTIHLVLPANLNAADMAALPIACQRLAPASLIFTKLDCTTRYGALVASAAQSGLPLGLATHAADMATPPLNLTPQWLAEALLQLPQQPWEFAA